MDKIVEKMLDELNHQKKKQKNNINIYLDKLKNKSNDFVGYSKVKLELEKCKYDLKKEYRKVGEYVINQYYDNNVIDFTYDEKYINMLEEIDKIKIYIKKLESEL